MIVGRRNSRAHAHRVAQILASIERPLVKHPHHELAATAAQDHIENARYYASLGAGDWIAVYSDGRVFFPAGRPEHPDVVLSAPLTRESVRSVKALRDALLASESIA